MSKKLLVQKILVLFFLMPSGLLGNLDNWHPLFGINGGIGLVTNAGLSQTFPQQTVNDQYYIYDFNGENKLPALYGGFLGFEWSGDSDWKFTINADYNQSSQFSVGGLLTQGLDVETQDTFDFSYNMRLRQLLGLIKFEYARSPKVSPYLLLGLGASFNLAQDYTTSVPATLLATRLYENLSTSSFSYALGLGCDVFILEQVRIGVGYRFANLGTIGLGQAFINNTGLPQVS